MIELFALIQNPLLLPLPAGGEGVGGWGTSLLSVQRPSLWLGTLSSRLRRLRFPVAHTARQENLALGRGFSGRAKAQLQTFYPSFPGSAWEPCPGGSASFASQLPIPPDKKTWPWHRASLWAKAQLQTIKSLKAYLLDRHPAQKLTPGSQKQIAGGQEFR
jgi:hypothetical protein